ncbi:ABC transporter ATP-binding protein [Rugosibacter aromaticivorans]|uniref:Probable ATP-binding protein YheS n=1 Tax=Rugosibacter aromaticivorans TaxID=1565605 RepID=A0A0C5JCX8_9PROT|nr:ATP-binding cassette domain-containing protein [Rugosibacter aromaticivorans]AJP49624.1 ABC transporter ATP-binding protein [Rugosibacter aromaticivorans]ART37145.1 D106 [uncultured bacterium]
MILLRNLGFSRNGDPLVEGASLQIHPGWKVGLTGANGCGKSSFLALLRGELHADRGDLERPASWVLAHVAQDTPALPDAALEFVLDGDIELRQIERDLLAAEQHPDDDHAGEQIGLLHSRLGEIDGYAARSRAASLMHGLGFTDADFLRPVAEFSGGWRVRLNLARALMCRSDLLLLDEPTNHLDLDAILWLETWLKNYAGTLILISHDRDFLDEVTSHIVHVENCRMQMFTGNYSACERARAERLANDMAMAEKQRRQAAHLQNYIDRFRAKASKARQAQSRIKMLEKMGDIVAAHIDTPFSFSFPEPSAFSDPLMVIDRVKIGYKNTAPILENLNFSLRPDSRIGLLGRNGAGKSTLMKLLAGDIQTLAGTREEGRNLKLGYFAQHQLEQLRPTESPLWHMIHQESALGKQTREQDLRSYLGSFDFRGDMVDAPCGRFSGGEKSRLALALMIRTAPNLLLLDEPTNHLDLEMREALTIALQETDAGMVLVSHDRHLLRATCDELWLVADGKVSLFDGDLDDYAEWLAEERSKEKRSGGKTAEKTAAKSASPAAQPSAFDSPEKFPKGRNALALATRQPLVKAADKLEKKLASWQAELAALAIRLADPALYTAADKTLLQTLAQRQTQLTTEIASTEERWLALQEQIEQVGEPAA